MNNFTTCFFLLASAVVFAGEQKFVVKTEIVDSKKFSPGEIAFLAGYRTSFEAGLAKFGLSSHVQNDWTFQLVMSRQDEMLMIDVYGVEYKSKKSMPLIHLHSYIAVNASSSGNGAEMGNLAAKVVYLKLSEMARKNRLLANKGLGAPQAPFLLIKYFLIFGGFYL